LLGGWDLLLRAKHLFVAAMVAGCGVTWLNEGGANWSKGARSARYFRRVCRRCRGGIVAWLFEPGLRALLVV
jgi:hypothetical protein